MDLQKWFGQQLQTSGDVFAWAVDQVPGERLQASPPLSLGEWTATRHVFHMLFYEKTLALPSMNQWLGAPTPVLGSLSKAEEAAYDPSMRTSDLLTQFVEVRQQQITLLSRFPRFAWEEPRSAVWGSVTLRWVLTKTLQHTAEHTHDVLRLSLFWDMNLARQKTNG